MEDFTETGNTWLYLIVGILIVSVAVETSPKIGGMLLVITVLGALVVAKRRGAI